jgi:predicted dehydrogenase
VRLAVGLTAPTPIRWAVAGTGQMAAGFVRDVRELDDVEFVAVGSRSVASAQAFAAAHGIPRAHGDYRELIRDSAVDVLYIATPHPHHYALARTAIEAGTPVLVEKAFTATLAGAEYLVSLARERGVFVMEAMWTRFLPALLRAGELIADGAIGIPHGVHANIGLWRPFDPTDRLFALDLGGGTTLDLGVYAASFAQHFLGRPEAVHARATAFPNGADANLGAFLEYADGRSATLMASLQATTNNRGVIFGSHGSIELTPHLNRPEVLIWQREGDSPVTEALPPLGDGYRYQVDEVNRCLRAGLIESPVMPLSDTLDVQWILEQCLQQTGREFAEAPLNG